MWFDGISLSGEPGKDELVAFVIGTTDFLSLVTEDQRFHFLWEADPRLKAIARQTFELDIAEGAAPELIRAISKIPEEAIRAHGLSGRPLKFKLRVVEVVAQMWDSVRNGISIKEWFKKIIDAIDALLDSLISAAGGAGGALKEFKDALRALV